MNSFFKKIFAIIVMASCYSAIASAYQQQGFVTYTEDPTGTVNFSCEAQCFLVIWPLGKYDMLTYKGTMGGNGQIWYGFLVGQQIYAAAIQNVDGSSEYSWDFGSNQTYSQIPKGAQVQIVLLVNGAVQGTQVAIQPVRLSASKNIKRWWSTFWKNESLMPYSINLRYGVKRGETPFFRILYWVFIIAFFRSLFFIKNRDKSHQAIMTRAIVLVVLFAGRNLLNRINWTNTTLHTYSGAPYEQATFFDLGDYPTFITKMRGTLKLDEAYGTKDCTIYFDAAQSWPFAAHANEVYIKPCMPAVDKTSADYIVYYKKPVDPENASKPQLLEYNGSVLLQNK